MSMKDDDQTITELARMLADANRARRLSEDAARTTPMLPLAAERERDEMRTLVAIEDLTKIIMERDEELIEVRKRLAEVERERDEARGQLDTAHAEAELSKDEQYLQALNDANADLSRKCDEACAKLAEAERNRDQARAALDAWRAEAQSANKGLDHIRRELAVVRRELAEAQIVVTRLRGLLKETLEAWREYLPFYSGSPQTQEHKALLARAEAAARGEA